VQSRNCFRQLVAKATVSKSAINKYHLVLQCSKSLICDLLRMISSLKQDAMGYATELDRCFIESLEYCK